MRDAPRQSQKVSLAIDDGNQHALTRKTLKNSEELNDASEKEEGETSIAFGLKSKDRYTRLPCRISSMSVLCRLLR